jgi:hypothetical protein
MPFVELVQSMFGGFGSAVQGDLTATENRLWKRSSKMRIETGLLFFSNELIVIRQTSEDTIMVDLEQPDKKSVPSSDTPNDPVAGLILSSTPTPEALAMGSAIGKHLIRMGRKVLLRLDSSGERRIIKAVANHPEQVIVFDSGSASLPADWETHPKTVAFLKNGGRIIRLADIRRHPEPDDPQHEIIRFFRRRLHMEIIIELPEQDPYIRFVEGEPLSLITCALDWPARLDINSGNRFLLDHRFAQEISLKTRRSPRAESVVIRNFFEELVEYKLIQVVKKSARGKVYGIYRNSMLWHLLEHYDPPSVLAIIENIIKSEHVPPSLTLSLNTGNKTPIVESEVNEKSDIRTDIRTETV